MGVESLAETSPLVARDAHVRTEAWHLVRLGLPLVLQQVVDVTPQVLIVMLISHLNNGMSKELMAASSLCGLFYRLSARSVVTGISTAMSTMSAQAHGAGKPWEIGLYFQAGVLVLGLCYVPLCILLLSCTDILVFMGQVPSVAETAGRMMYFNLPALPFFALYMLQSNLVQGQNRVLPLVFVDLAGQACMIGTAYVLMYHTSLGIVGVVAAGAVTEVLKCTALFSYIAWSGLLSEDWQGWDIAAAWRLVPGFAKLGAAGAVVTMCMAYSKYAITILAGRLPDGAAAISASAGYDLLVACFSMVVQGLSLAGCIRIGNALGANDAPRAKAIARLVLGLAAVWGLVAGAFMCLFRDLYLAIYMKDPSVRDLASTLILTAAPFQMATAVLTTLLAVLQGCGLQSMGAKMSFTAYAIIGIPLGAVLAFVNHSDIAGLWLGVLLGVTTVAIAGLIWIARLDWDHMAADAKERTQDATFQRKL
ncbi:Multidrug/Oligosaccharidyl-lipid/Polysaccharide (MOP) Flippase Superfamily [Achlya hypogyna]|uniref:Multidrug/Oligosaccharidyl-lipid/Polysaccharide (MOP) Flippase Superfamily n=1 Tax=Achlya hypogyna TaxID=1202772 RepID=A0A1V9Y501_ACHHY|nr:Multidrug/Oligosaccharidyl-lipid/Polysaccharide (MOP) Flippase Superfamily [Achlya hypogyna]